MSLVCKSDSYKAYYNLCIYMGKKPLSMPEWRNTTPSNRSKNIDDIKKELNKIIEFA